MKVWLRVCKSWEEEAAADREYYQSFTPDERVAMIDDLHRQWEKINGMVETENRDFRHLLTALNKHGVRYVIVGGYAFAFHVKPRYTKDLDIFVEPTEENAVRVLSALAEFGFGELRLTTRDFEEGQIVLLGVEPHRIDLITRIAAVSFEDAWSSRMQGTYMKVPVQYIGREALMRNKAAVGRPQDLADLDALR
jgi:predicted nucleotidyltransferase